MRQERIDFSGRSGADPDKYIFHPCAEVDVVCLAGSRHALHDRQMLAAGSLPANSQFFRPSAMGLIIFSARLLSMFNFGFFKNIESCSSSFKA